MASFEGLSSKLIEVVIGLFILLAVAVALMPSIHTQFTYFIANLTAVGLGTASTLAGIVETILWLLVVVAIVKGVQKHVKT